MPKCRQQLSILVVDDNPADRELMRRGLRDRGVAVDLVNNGKEALSLLGLGDPEGPVREPPDLILLDLNMPIVDGKQFLREYRSTAAGSGVPVVVFTSSNDIMDIVQSYDAGATSYVVKPVDLEPFRDTLDSVIRYWLETSAPFSTGRQGKAPN